MNRINTFHYNKQIQSFVLKKSINANQNQSYNPTANVFYAAAGTFSEMQSEKDFTLIEGPENIKQNNDYFACKIVGESMNRTIPNGSICLFKSYTGGSRNGKIVLVENFDIQESEDFEAFENEDTISILNRYIEEAEVNLDKTIVQKLLQEVYQEACELV